MRIALYGGFAEKGRTCVGVERAGYRVLLDAGVMTSARARTDYYPAIGGDNLRAQVAPERARGREVAVAELQALVAPTNGQRARAVGHVDHRAEAPVRQEVRGPLGSRHRGRQQHRRGQRVQEVKVRLHRSAQRVMPVQAA